MGFKAKIVKMLADHKDGTFHQWIDEDDDTSICAVCGSVYYYYPEEKK